MKLAVRRFGASTREMVGVHQATRADRPCRARFLLCRPMGQEAVRTAAVYRVLADRLAREGCASLRFDPHGTGDSPGEEGDQSLAGWTDDVLAAHEQLGSEGEGPVHWFGMGLGATLALRAALRVKLPPAHLVLWEPVLNGPQYARALLDGHRAELTREFGEPWERLLRQGKVTEPSLPGDVLGFEVGATLAEELQQLQGLNVAGAMRRGIVVSCAVHEEQRAAFAGLARNELLRMHTIETRTDWMSSQAMNTAIVPPDLPRLLLATLD